MNLELVKKYFQPINILDIGGNIGEFYRQTKETFPDSKCFVVEGNEDCEPFLKELGAPYFIKLLGRESGKVIFYKTAESLTCTGNSVYRELSPVFGDDKVIKVEKDLVPLDSIFETSHFDLIKIDTQGSELDILAGGKRVCQNAKGIILEVSIKQYNKGSPLREEVAVFMDRYGFRPAELLKDNYHNGEIWQKDILFLNKKIFPK